MASLFVLVLLFITACSDEKADVQPLYFQGQTMGTSFNITVIPRGPQVSSTELKEHITQEFARINKLMSTYIVDSEINRFNKQQPVSTIAVSHDFCHLIALSRTVHSISNGAYNPAVGPLVNLWGFGPEVKNTETPSDSDVAELLKNVDFSAQDNCLQNDTVYTIVKKTPLQIDFSAVAKGYAADKVGKLLKAQGYTDFLVEVGGELTLSGLNKAGRPWRIAIEKPTLFQTGVQLAIELTDVGMATSGDYRNYFEVDGKRFSHTIDPRTGRPVTHNLASVTVIAQTAAKADALATAFIVLGYEDAMNVAEKLAIPAFFLLKQDDEFIEKSSSSFEKYLVSSS